MRRFDHRLMELIAMFIGAAYNGILDTLPRIITALQRTDQVCSTRFAPYLERSKIFLTRRSTQAFFLATFARFERQP